MTEVARKRLKKISVTVSKPLFAVVAIIFGTLIIALPDFLEWIASLFFAIECILLLGDYLELRRR
jgi:hypothetical protein